MKKLIILIIALIFISGCTTKNCGADLNCFQERAKDCLKAKVNIFEGETNLRLTSRGEWFGECKLSIKIEKIDPLLFLLDPTLKQAIEGKTINCAIPKEIVKENENYVEDILSMGETFDKYCSGPVKDILKGTSKEIIKINI